MRFVLDQFPLAPTTNHLYASGWGGRRHRSGQYDRFLKTVGAWALKRDQLLKSISAQLREEIASSPQKWIRVNMFFCLPQEMIFTKGKKAKDKLQEWDACNRVKATHDALAKLIDIDDRYFAVGRAEKVQTSQDPYTLIVIETATIVSDTSLIEGILGWNQSKASSST